MTGAAAIVDEIEALYAERGGEAYGEEVTLFEHSLLTAATARAAGASASLIAAALLHDIGHLLTVPDSEFGKYDHDTLGADWLAERFPPEVAEPVRHHVAAKRYLCAVDPGYFDVLSSASQHTLEHQGGVMDRSEATAFERVPYFAEGVQLRRWEDEFGKIADLDVPDFAEFRSILESLVVA